MLIVDLHFVVFVVVLHVSSFVDVFHFVGVVSFFDFQATLPYHQHSTLAFQTREGLSSAELWALARSASATVLSEHFLPTGVFYLTLFPDIFGTFLTFWHNPLLSRFHCKQVATFLKVAGLHPDPRNTDQAYLLVWFTVIHNIL